MSPPEDFNKQQYSVHFQQYLESNPTGEIGGGSPKQRVHFLKRFLPIGRSVLEIGSGGGNDALELQNAGYKVTASEFIDRFLNELKNKGLKTIYLDAKKDEIPPADGIYANAVFVHFSPQEIADFLKRAKPVLQNEKVLFFSVIKGEGQERSARNRGFEREFHYYALDSITPILSEEKFRILQADDTDPKWLQIIASGK